MSLEKQAAFQPELHEGQDIVYTPLRIVRHFGEPLLNGETVSLEALVLAPDIPGYSIICQQGENGLLFMNTMRKKMAESLWNTFYVIEGVGDEVLFMRPRPLPMFENSTELSEEEHESIIGIGLTIQTIFEDTLNDEMFHDIREKLTDEYKGEVPLVHIGVDYSQHPYDTMLLTLNNLGNQWEITSAGRLNNAKRIAKDKFVVTSTSTGEYMRVKETDYIDADSQELTEFPANTMSPRFFRKLYDNGFDISIKDGLIHVAIQAQRKQDILQHSQLFTNTFPPIENPQITYAKERNLPVVLTTNNDLGALYPCLVPAFIREGKRKPSHLETDQHRGESLFLQIGGFEAINDPGIWKDILDTDVLSPYDFAQIRGEFLRFIIQDSAQHLSENHWDIDQTEVWHDFSLKVIAFHDIYTDRRQQIPDEEHARLQFEKDNLRGLYEATREVIQSMGEKDYTQKIATHFEEYFSSRGIPYAKSRLQAFMDTLHIRAYAGMASCLADNLDVVIHELPKIIPDGAVLVGGKLPSFCARLTYLFAGLQRSNFIVLQENISTLLDLDETTVEKRNVHFKGFNGTNYKVAVVSVS